MEITIEQLVAERGRLYAEYRCQLGRATGIWHGDRLPVPFRAQVEIDIDDDDAIVLTGCAPAYDISCAGNVTRVTGQVASTGDDVLCVRLGDDVFQLEALPSVRLQPGDWIRIETTALHLYPFSL